MSSFVHLENLESENVQIISSHLELRFHPQFNSSPCDFCSMCKYMCTIFIAFYLADCHEIIALCEMGIFQQAMLA